MDSRNTKINCLAKANFVFQFFCPPDKSGGNSKSGGDSNSGGNAKAGGNLKAGGNSKIGGDSKIEDNSTIEDNLFVLPQALACGLRNYSAIGFSQKILLLKQLKQAGK